MEDVSFALLYTFAELYGVQRHIIWKGSSPDGKILAAGRSKGSCLSIELKFFALRFTVDA